MEIAKRVKVVRTVLAGLAAGLVNGLFGAGGGLITVPMLQSLGLEGKKAHKNAVFVMLFITVVSAFFYLKGGFVSLSDAKPFILSGIIGSLAGTLLIRKIPKNLLKKIFAGFMIYGGIRMLFK